MSTSVSQTLTTADTAHFDSSLFVKIEMWEIREVKSCLDRLTFVVVVVVVLTVELRRWGGGGGGIETNVWFFRQSW